MAIPQATLGDVYLDASSNVSWTLTQGVNAPRGLFTVRNEAAQQILAQRGKPISLRSNPGDGEGDSIAIHNLYVLYEAPAGNPYLTSVVVSDRRWWWMYKHIRKRFNVRWRTGTKRMVDGRVRTFQQYPTNVTYHRKTLFGERTKWRALDVIKWIVEQGLGEPLKIDVSPGLFDELPIENFVIDDRGDRALARALTKIPGATIYIDPRGNVVLTNQRDADRVANVVTQMSPLQENGGYLINRDQQAVRPRDIIVYFTREMSVRFDWSHNQTLTDKGRYLINVIQSPDLNLEIDKKQYGQGSWVDLDENLYGVWNTTRPTGTDELTDEIIRTQMPWGMLDMTYGQIGDFSQTHRDWRARIAHIKKHWRQSFRINRQWVEASLRIIARRNELLDPENSLWGRAFAYTDFAVQPEQRGMLADPDKVSYWYNVEGYPDDDKLRNENAYAAPAIVQVPDEQAGIVRLNWVADPMRQEIYHPAPLNGAPKFDPTSDELRYDQVRGDNLGYREEQSISIVLTLVPTADDGIQALHPVRFTPKQLGVKGEALGPTLHVRAPQQVTARYGWDDDFAGLIGQAFGFEVNKTPLQLANELRPMLINEEEINVVAEAIARAVYDPYEDHLVGTRVGLYEGQAVPTQGVQSVTHTLNTNGKTSTSITALEELPPVNPFSYVPENIRDISLRLVQL